MIRKNYGYNLKINKNKSYARINRYIYKEYEQSKKMKEEAITFGWWNTHRIRRGVLEKKILIVLEVRGQVRSNHFKCNHYSCTYHNAQVGYYNEYMEELINTDYICF